MIVKVQPTQYGEIIKLSFNKDSFLENPFNNKGWLNVDILTSKEGKKYAKINDYKKVDATASNEVEEDTITEEEIPF
jgi:hypothetical protein